MLPQLLSESRELMELMLDRLPQEDALVMLLRLSLLPLRLCRPLPPATTHPKLGND